jgi:uncharacterized repeat protein (TIGR03803 family)
MCEALEPRMLLSAYTFASIASFTGKVGGFQPQGLVMDAAGNLFGVTAMGGAKGYGTVFEIAAGSGTITTLASFTGHTTAAPNGGIGPRGNLVLDQGNLYGTTVGGGASGKGTIFEVANIAAGTASSITTVASFDGANGSFPFAGLVVDAAGNFFGTSLGSSRAGYHSTVWERAAGSSAITALATFKSTDLLEGALATDSSGNIFGTTARGGTNKLGSVFEISGTAHTLTTLVSFTNTNGATPSGTLLLDSQHNLIGTTAYGGASGDGTIFEVPATASSTIRTLATFTGANGEHPLGTLILDGAGNLFGVTAAGGTKGYGTVFERAAGTANTITTLCSFTGASTGVNPTGPLVLDAQGNLWGATYLGGAHSHNAGTVFELSPVVVGLAATAAAPLHLVITQQPASIGSGKAFTLVVKVEDAAGRVVTTVNSSATLTLASGPSTGAFKGTHTVKFVKGVASFAALSLTGKGAYSIAAQGDALAGVLSKSITVS